jgi:hypothetical protein
VRKEPGPQPDLIRTASGPHPDPSRGWFRPLAGQPPAGRRSHARRTPFLSPASGRGRGWERRAGDRPASPAPRKPGPGRSGYARPGRSRHVPAPSGCSEPGRATQSHAGRAVRRDAGTTTGCAWRCVALPCHAWPCDGHPVSRNSLPSHAERGTAMHSHCIACFSQAEPRRAMQSGPSGGTPEPRTPAEPCRRPSRQWSHRPAARRRARVGSPAPLAGRPFEATRREHG